MSRKYTLAIAVAVTLFSLSLPVHAQSRCKKQPVEDLVKAVAEGFETKTMRSLDAQKPYVGSVRIVIEHSLAPDDDKDRFVIRSFTSLARAERWLKSREHERECTRHWRIGNEIGLDPAACVAVNHAVEIKAKDRLAHR